VILATDTRETARKGGDDRQTPQAGRAARPPCTARRRLPAARLPGRDLRAASWTAVNSPTKSSDVRRELPDLSGEVHRPSLCARWGWRSHAVTWVVPLAFAWPWPAPGAQTWSSGYPAKVSGLVKAYAPSGAPSLTAPGWGWAGRVVPTCPTSGSYMIRPIYAGSNGCPTAAGRGEDPGAGLATFDRIWPLPSIGGFDLRSRFLGDYIAVKIVGGQPRVVYDHPPNISLPSRRAAPCARLIGDRGVYLRFPSKRPGQPRSLVPPDADSERHETRPRLQRARPRRRRCRAGLHLRPVGGPLRTPSTRLTFGWPPRHLKWWGAAFGPAPGRLRPRSRWGLRDRDRAGVVGDGGLRVHDLRPERSRGADRAAVTVTGCTEQRIFHSVLASTAWLFTCRRARHIAWCSTTSGPAAGLNMEGGLADLGAGRFHLPARDLPAALGALAGGCWPSPCRSTRSS
jgi:hypothetical protein